MKQAIVVICILFLASMSWATSNSLVIKSQVKLSEGQEATLSDLLVNNSAAGRVSAKVLQELVSIRGASEETKVTSKELAFKVRGLTKKLPEGSRLIFPKELKVVPYDQVDGTNIQAQLIKSLKNVCSDCRFEVRALNIPAVLEKNKEGWSLQNIYQLPKGNFAYQITNKKLGLRSTLSGRVETYKKVPVAKRLIKMGEPLSLAAVTIEYRNVTFAIDSAVSKIELNGRIAKRTITAGSVIWNSAIKVEHAVLRGQVAKLIVDEGSYQLTMMVKAMQSGRVGETLPVRSLKSNKTMLARVKAKGSLVLE